MPIEHIPQRFRWVSAGYSRWKYGAVVYNCTHETWELHTFGLHPMDLCLYLREVETRLAKLIGDVSKFEWIDNDLGFKPIEKAGGS